MASAPRVSVVVPVRDRKALLRRLLDALAAQSEIDHEVVIVDDGSVEDVAAEVAADARRGRPVRVVRNLATGAYAARRTGVAAARADYLAFTDSDCVPGPDWLARGVAALDAGADVVNGLTLPERPPGPLERTMASGLEGLYPTCNVFYRRRSYEEAGGFDDGAAQRFGFRTGSREAAMGFGEDTLLAWKVRRRGRATYAPEAIVHHHVFAPDRADLYQRTRMMVAFPALFREVPELRDGPLVRHRVVLNTPNRAPVYAMAAACVTRRRAAVVAAGAWWLALRARDLCAAPGSTRSRMAALPSLLGVDVLTTAALVAGSVRTGTVVL